jgi:hypothetical protein
MLAKKLRVNQEDSSSFDIEIFHPGRRMDNHGEME